MNPKIKILYLEYVTGAAAEAENILRKAGNECEIYVANDEQSFQAALINIPDIIISDDAQPALNTIGALTILKEKRLHTPLIVVAAAEGVNTIANAVNIIKHGAYDYITQEDINTLPGAITSALKKHKDKNTAGDNLFAGDERYRQIVETAQEGIWITDENLTTIFVNKKMCDMLGYAAGEIVGKHKYDFKTKAEKLNIGQLIEEHKLGFIETHESTFITKNGKQILCIVATNGLFDAEGRYFGTLAMLTDITHRTADEQALRRSEANLSAIIENTTDLVYSLDRDLKFITFNQLFKNTMKSVYGFNIEQGVSTVDMIKELSPELAAKWKNIYAKALTGETLQFVNEYPLGDEKVYLSYSINPIWETGNVIGLSCFSRDITKQKLDEAAIRKSEASLRTIFNNTDMGCVLVDGNGKIVSFNTVAKKFALEQRNKEAKEGDSVLDYVRGNRHGFVRDILNSVKKGTAVNYQVSDDATGVVKWYDITWAGIRDDDNQEFGYIFTLKDITEKKKLEIEREKITADIIQRNKALEQFTYIISHNLRAPVANISGLSALITSMDVEKSEISEIINSIGHSAHKLDEVISDLNQILQVNEDVNESIEPIALPKLIDDIKFSIRNLIGKEQVKLNCDFGEADTMLSVKSFIHSIFYNLILNSIKYRNPGAGPVITIVTKVNDSRIRIHFTDNGRGIDTSRYANEIFGLYKRFDTTVEGKGMGLFMVKMQVESLGGTISVESTLNKGTEFTLEFPQVHLEKA